jgi:predicted heme/steroid binding protein
MNVLRSFKNESEVSEYAKTSGKKMIIFESSVYDVECFFESHPGGKDVLVNNLNKVID